MGLFNNLFRRRRNKDELPHAYNEQHTPSEPINTAEKKAAKPKNQNKVKSEIEIIESHAVAKSKRKPSPNTAKKSEAAKENADSRSARTGKFQIKSTKDGRYVFNLYSSNRSIIATSQIYSSPKSALGGINSVIANAAIAGIEDTTTHEGGTLPFPKWEIYVDKANRFRFRLNATNGNCICHSRSYSSKSSCKKCIESVIKSVKNATIEKDYLKNSDQDQTER